MHTWIVNVRTSRVPADVVSTRHFDRWWKRARHETPDLLTFTPEMLTNAAAAGQVRVADFPDEVPLTQGLTLSLSYAFAPGAAEDGVTVKLELVLPGSLLRLHREGPRIGCNQ